MSTRLAARTLVGGTVSLVAIVLLAGPAGAHTTLESSNPGDGARVRGLTRIDLRFTEAIEVAASHVWLRDTAGYLELAGATTIDGNRRTLTVPVPPLGEGTYEVTWHVVAADGDPVQGTFTVTVEPDPVTVAAADPLDPAADFPPDTSLAVPLASVRSLGPPPALRDHGHGPGDVTKGLARGLLDTSLAVLVGGIGFVAVVWPKGARLLRSRQVLWCSAGVAAVASMELTAFQHAGATGTSTLAALTPAQQWGSLAFHFGRVGAARLALLGVVLVLLALLVRRPGGERAARPAPAPSPSRVWIVAAVAAAVGLAETMVLLGTSSGALSIAGLARLTHVVGISAWLGGLVMLLVVALPRRRSAELVTLLPRFSAFATASIGVLVVGGVLLAVDHVGSVGQLTGSDYGRVLLAKLVLVALTLVVASLSRSHVRLELRRPTPDGAALARPLVQWAGIEVGLLVAVMAITAVLVSRVPPA